MKYSKLAVIALLVNNSASTAVNHNRHITDQLREMASKGPEIGVIQHKLERLDSLKGRLNNAMDDVHEILRPLPETTEPKAPLCKTCHTHEIRHLSRRALDRIEGRSSGSSDTIADLANQALKNLGGMGGGNMAREAENGNNSVEHLAGKALEALTKGSSQA